MKNKGITLIEVLVASVLSSIILIGTISYIYVSTSITSNLTNQLTARSAIQILSETIIKDVRNSDLASIIIEPTKLVLKDKNTYLLNYLR